MSLTQPTLILLKLLRAGVGFCAGSAVVIAAVVLSKDSPQGPDHALLAVVAAVIAGAVALIWAIGREIRSLENKEPGRGP